MADNKTGRLESVEYRYTKPNRDRVNFNDDEIKICKTFFEKESLVTFAREDIFKKYRGNDVHYPYIFIEGTDEFRSKLLLQDEPKATLVLFLRQQNDFNDRFLDFVDRIASYREFNNRIGLARKFILVSNNPNIVSEVENLRTNRPGMRVVIPFSYDDFFDETQSQKIWQKFHKRFKQVDLFAYDQALINDWDFVGRKLEIQKLYDIYSARKNGGLFGLRKIGKTSVLYALMRQFRTEERYAFYIDCSRPFIHQKRWFELIQYLGEQILDEWQRHQESHDLPKINRDKYIFNEKTCDETLSNILCDATKGMNEKRFLIIFDEIDKITYGLSSETHWNGEGNNFDFLKFWNSIRSICQHHPDWLGYIVAGINPRIFEMQFVNNSEDNPIFSGGNPDDPYLPPFLEIQINEMVSRISMLMGVNFSEGIYSLLMNEYGGHPFLTRKACSILVREARKDGITNINGLFFEDKKAAIALELGFNVDQITGELEKAYPEEYNLLQLLAIGEHERFQQEKNLLDSSATTHLQSYGLTKKNGDVFQITIPAVKDRLISKSRIISYKEGQSNKKKTDVEAKHGSVLSDLVRITGSSGDYNQQKNIIVSQWERWKLVFGDISSLYVYFDIAGQFKSENHLKTDIITKRKYFDISEEDYKKYLMAFDWIRERINVYINTTSQDGIIEGEPKEGHTRQIIVQGNVYGGDHIEEGVKVAGNADRSIISAGDNNSFDKNKFFEDTIKEIHSKTNLTPEKKKELEQEITTVKVAVADGEDVGESFLEKRLKNIRNLAPEIADVFLASLISPASGFAMVVQKIAKRVKESSA